MHRKLVKTEDGSHTMYVPELGEHYHSIHGAIRESEHIFIQAAFQYHKKDPVRLLEFGMGTGLNVLLTYIHAVRSGRKVYYHTIEKYPITRTEKELLNLSWIAGCEDCGVFDKIHDSNWGEEVEINSHFCLYKDNVDFRDAHLPGPFDLIYFDAFAPEVQPELWSEIVFHNIYNSASPGAVLTTYSAKGMVRRHLKAAGFKLEKIPGPPGKREITRAVKYFS